MLRKKHSSSDKKRKRSRSVERHDKDERKPAVTKLTLDSKDELADAELDRISSDMEEGGLNLSLLFHPITAYVSNKHEMLEQCFHVLGEKKLHKMLPEELKDCSLEEIKRLCWEQLEPISEKNLLEILAGEDITSQEEDKKLEETLVSQQDNNVDSTSCLKEMAKTEDPKQECGASGEESDVLSINADTYDSEIEGSKEEQNNKTAEKAAKTKDNADPIANPDPVKPEPNPSSPSRGERKKDIQSDIDKSVSEILSLSSAAGSEVTAEHRAPPLPTPTPTPLPPSADISTPAQGRPAAETAPGASQPSIQQLELLELEMRARAIKALMKASELRKASVSNS